MHQHKKRYGQNFLKDLNLLKKIVKEADVTAKTVIEVGPGEGALTQFLALSAKQVTAYEIDLSLKPVLEKLEESYPSLQVVYQDFLKIELENVEADIIIGNIPYYITTPIIFKFYEAKRIKKAVFMMQKEVAERLLAKPNTKAYNALSVVSQWLCDVRKVMDVNRRLFFPIPKVDSVVIEFVKNENQFDEGVYRFIKQSFSQKRKTLVNNLVESYPVDKSFCQAFLREESIQESIRAEQLSVSEFITLSQKWLNRLKSI